MESKLNLIILGFFVSPSKLKLEWVFKDFHFLNCNCNVPNIPLPFWHLLDNFFLFLHLGSKTKNLFKFLQLKWEEKNPNNYFALVRHTTPPSFRVGSQ